MSPRVRVLVRIAVRVVVALAILTAACILAGVVVLRSGWFQEKIRERIITEIEHTTGARVEMGVFRFDEEHMTATVSPLVVHGTEPAGEAPLIRADSVTVGLRIISLVERKVDLGLLRLERPTVRVAFYPDGSNNVPQPRRPVTWTEDLLNLQVRRYEIVDGVLDWDDRILPLNLRGERLRITASYDRRGPRYRGELSALTRVVVRGVPPIETETSLAFGIVKSGIQIERLHLATRDSHVDVSGDLTNPRAPRGKLSVKAAMSMKDVVEIFGVPSRAGGLGQLRRTDGDRVHASGGIRNGRPGHRARTGIFAEWVERQRGRLARRCPAHPQQSRGERPVRESFGSGRARVGTAGRMEAAAF